MLNEWINDKWIWRRREKISRLNKNRLILEDIGLNRVVLVGEEKKGMCLDLYFRLYYLDKIFE